MPPQHKTFYVGIKGVIVNPTTKQVLVLISQRADGSKRWDLPGGRINVGENYLQALKRELSEEVSNVAINEIGGLVAVYQLDQDLKDGQGLFLVAFKVLTDFTGTVALSKEHVGYRWFSLTELPSLATDTEVDLESDWLLKGCQLALS